MPRPSLSDDLTHPSAFVPYCVAGVYAPAFVERAWRECTLPQRHGGVAGVYAPAFVERGLQHLYRPVQA